MDNLLEIIEKNREIIIVVLLCVLIMELLFSLLRQRKMEKRKTRKVESEFAKFCDELSVNGKDVFLLVEKDTQKGVYITQNVQKILGVSPQLIQNDIWMIQRVFAQSDFRKLRKAVEGWDGKDKIEISLPYYNVETQQKYWGQILIQETLDQKYYLCMLEDMSKEHQTVLAMKKEVEEVHRLEESKTTFLSKMSHEIRTPMNGILGMISLAKMNIESAKEAEDYLEKAENLSQFLLSIINDILDMSRIESGKVELACEKVDIFAMADKLKDMFQTTIEDRGIEFVLEVKDFTIRYVMGDELRMEQIMINFLSNASKFTSVGGKISVIFRQMDIIEDKVNLMFCVRDSGKGMSKEFLSRIFNPFAQEDATTAKEHGGSGLGMSIADNLVHLMGGEITVNSEIGKGTEFTVFLELPIAAGDQTMPTSHGEVIEEKEEAFSMDGYRLLLAEDNDINALVASKLLVARGASVERAKDGEEVVAMFEAKEEGYYDVILMDIQMPKQNGWQATRKIRELSREDAKKIPIIALSADAFVEDKRKSLEIGMNGHVGKPIDYEELASVIKDCSMKSS